MLKVHWWEQRGPCVTKTYTGPDHNYWSRTRIGSGATWPPTNALLTHELWDRLSAVPARTPGWAAGASTRREHMKPYMVEITTYGVVMAENEAHAHQVADSYKREIFGDDWNPRIEVDGAVVKVEDLAHGWDGECIPYGGDGNTKLADLLVPNEQN